MGLRRGDPQGWEMGTKDAARGWEVAPTRVGRGDPQRWDVGTEGTAQSWDMRIPRALLRAGTWGAPRLGHGEQGHCLGLGHGNLRTGTWGPRALLRTGTRGLRAPLRAGTQHPQGWDMGTPRGGTRGPRTLLETRTWHPQRWDTETEGAAQCWDTGTEVTQLSGQGHGDPQGTDTRTEGSARGLERGDRGERSWQGRAAATRAALGAGIRGPSGHRDVGSKSSARTRSRQRSGGGGTNK